MSYVRADAKYDSLESLKTQLDADLLNVRQIPTSYKDQELKASIATVSILNYNGEEYLEAYLPSVQTSSQKYNVETWVIDNASTDGLYPSSKSGFQRSIW